MPDTTTIVDRTSRDAVSRDASVRGMQTRNPEEFRKLEWRPADALPMPKAPPGVHYRYVRKSIRAEQDVNNFGRYMREGWVTVPLSEHPELETSVEPSARNSNLIQIGDLILCKISEEVVRARNEYYQAMNSRQMEAVDKNLMRENDPRMPLFSQRETKVSFGKGS